MCPDKEFDEDNSTLILGPIHKQRWIYSCSKQLLDRVIWAYGEQEAAVHPVPPLQLDRAQAGQPRHRQGRQLPGHDPVHPQPGRAGAHPAGGRRQPEALLHLRRGRHRLPDADHRERRRASPTARSSTSATRTTRPRSRSWPTCSGTCSGRTRTTKTTGVFSEIVETPHEAYYGKGYQDIISRKPSIAKARELLGWEPKTDLDDVPEKLPWTPFWRRPRG